MASEHRQQVSEKITFVIPTLNEGGNLGPLLLRIHRTMAEEGFSWEVLVVDDGSVDGTPEEAVALSLIYPVRFLARDAKRGLASAILDGIHASGTDIVVIMDADGSHPPESLSSLLKPIMEEKADLVVGSRYVKGASLEGWNRWRAAGSRIASVSARTLTPVRDPLAGYFALRKNQLPLQGVRPRGFKLLLEILARNPALRVKEVPIAFSPRNSGKSKMGIRTLVDFVCQWAILVRKWGLRRAPELLRFSAVGLMGMGLDFLAFEVLTRAFRLPPLYAQTLSFWIAATHNFLWNRWYTFEHGRLVRPGVSYVRYILITLVSFSFRTGVMIYLMREVDLGSEITLLGGILTAAALNYTGSKVWAFGRLSQGLALLVPLREKILWGCIGMLLAWRLLYAGILQLIPEEAYYWNYAMHPSMSYFDHPPMVAWVIRAGTLMAGNSELGIRLGFLLLGLGSSWVLYRLGKLWFDRSVGLGAALAFHILPFPFGVAFFAVPDGPLFFFWLMTIYTVSLGLLRGDGSWWILAGASLGLGLLSKYSAILLVPSVGLLLAGRREFRRWLLRPEPYLGLIIATVFFAPVILWNAHHDWASFRFQFASRLRHHEYFPLLNLVRFLGSQMAVQTPFVFAGLILALMVALKRGRAPFGKGWAFATAFSLPCLGGFGLYGLQSWVKINWTAPAYLSLVPAGLALYLRSRAVHASWFVRFVRAGVQGTPYVFLLFAVLALYHLTVGIGGISAPPRAVAWRPLAEQAIQMKASLRAADDEDPFVLGLDKYAIASELAFYMRNPGDTYSQNVVGGKGLGYAYWGDPTGLAGRSAVAILEGDKQEKLQALCSRFQWVGKPRVVWISWAGRDLASFLIVPCKGFVPLMGN